MYVRKAAAALVGSALLLAACSGEGGTATESDDPRPRITQQPKDADPFWVDPDGTAARQVAAYEKAGDTGKAGLIRRIAEQPTGAWLGPDDPEGRARRVTEAAGRAGRTALLVLYDIPHRDCGQYSRGGAPDCEAYRAWIAAFALCIFYRPALIFL